MKRGNFAPRARARWQSANSPAGYPNWPTWVKVTSALWTYLDPSGPGAETIHEYNLTWGQWSYQPLNGMVFYSGRWDNGSKTGAWRFGVQPANLVQTSFMLFGITIDSVDPTLGRWLKSTGTAVIDGKWDPAHPTNIPDQHEIEKQSPWLTWGGGQLTGVTYKELELAGDEPHNTAPLTWAGTVWPP